jgi:hypothetical protein
MLLIKHSRRLLAVAVVFPLTCSITLQMSLAQTSLAQTSLAQISPAQIPPAQNFANHEDTSAPAIAVSMQTAAPENSNEKSSNEKSFEDASLSPRFHKGVRERDLSIGFGAKPNFILKDRSDVSLLQFTPRWGRFRDEHQEWLWEVPITYFYQPDDAYAVGVNLMLRQHFGNGSDFVPFVEAGGGFVLTNFNRKIPELNGSFQFSPQVGIGVRKKLGRDHDLVVAVRLYHLSNANTKAPNIGLNTYLITVGYSRLF